jgi:hypothetical protein
MKFSIIFFLVPQIALATYYEAYTQSGGNNLNGGGDTNNTATFTSTNGGYTTATDVFVPTDGQNPVTQGVTVGQLAHVYVDGATSPTGMISRVTAVTNASNGSITLNTTGEAGSEPSTLASGRSIRIGGAWKGPNGADGWPLTIASIGNIKDASNNPLRVNMKNDATYSITAQIIGGGSGMPTTFQGYTSTVGDGGRAVIDGGTNAIILLNPAPFAFYTDMEFSNNGTTGTNTLVSGGGGVYWRCVFHDSRGFLLADPGNAQYVECEFYNGNKSNTASLGLVTVTGATPHHFLYCYFHDSNNGANNVGVVNLSYPIFRNCIFDSIQGDAISYQNSGVTSWSGMIINCDFYNIGGNAIKYTGNSSTYLGSIVANTNFVKITGNVFDTGVAFTTSWWFNNGYGSGSMGNGGKFNIKGNVDEVGAVTYPSGFTPWFAPSTGDFRIALGAAMSTGRGFFLETGASKSGTVGYPDIGAANHPDTIDTPLPHTIWRSIYGF